MNNTIKVGLTLLHAIFKGIFAIPLAVIMLFTVTFIGVTNLLKMLYSNTEVPIKLSIEFLGEVKEVVGEVKEEEVKIEKEVETVVAKVRKPRGPRKPKEVVTEVENTPEPPVTTV